MRARTIIGLLCLLGATWLRAQTALSLPQTTPLTNRGDLSAEMVAGIDRWLIRETERVASERTKRWQAPPAEEVLRSRLQTIIGAVDELAANPQFTFSSTDRSKVFRYIAPRDAELHRAQGARPFLASNVRWPVMEDVFAEGLLLEPADEKGVPVEAVADVIVLPDADQCPEELAGLRPGIPPESMLARNLAQSGWRVLVPVVISRSDSSSGNERLKRFTNQPHREWIYRQAYELGRHIIGFEVEKVLAAITAMQSGKPVALAGYGEGGLIALHAAALDKRVGATLVSGYFSAREELWREPIYRNLFGYLRDFGDAEVASLAAGKVIVEHSQSPQVKGPPAPRNGRSGAAPGVISTPEFAAVETEVERANGLLAKRNANAREVTLVHGSEGMAVQFGSRKALAALAEALNVKRPIVFDEAAAIETASLLDVNDRQQRAVRELESFTQTLFRRSEAVRDALVWKDLANTNQFLRNNPQRRESFSQSVMGKISAAKSAPNPRTRQIYDKPKWTGYEVMLDVFPDVFAWGYLLVPKDLKPGEHRPVVVCQHGLEGVPEDTVTDDPQSTGFKYYRAFAARLAERGFIVYAPHNPYRGHDKFRVLQRKANPLGLSLFSFIIAQHEVTTDWLASLPFVDPQRIAFYGLSYGGKTAMRVPAVVEHYCLSICSGDFNEWVQKNVTTESPYSYLFTGEYEMPEWDLGHTFNYAEMASLIFPKPFMVERGHDDGVAPDAWVAYEYAKVRRLYDNFGLGDRTEIEFFNGPHQIHGAGTFKFLHQHLNWPEPSQ